jgi:hypothetical protein
LFSSFLLNLTNLWWLREASDEPEAQPSPAQQHEEEEEEEEAAEQQQHYQ